jgi:hypothetical protein
MVACNLDELGIFAGILSPKGKENWRIIRNKGHVPSAFRIFATN